MSFDKIGDAYKFLCSRLNQSEAAIIMKRRACVDLVDIISNPNKPISLDARSLLQKDVERRLNGQPLARMYGARDFYGMEFAISKDTLEPRFDTETLVDLALNGAQPRFILDLGTGSGCILLALLKHWTNAYGVGVDISLDAIKTAKYNAKMHGLDGRSSFVCANWAGSINENKFDLIVSNPPYIKTKVIDWLDYEVKMHDPITALDGGGDGLDAYRSIYVDIARILKIGGRALFEIGYDQGAQLRRMAGEHGFKVTKIARDLGGRDRVIEIYHGDKNVK